MALYDDGCSGVLNRVHAQLLHVLPSSLFAMSSKCVSDVMVKWKMKSWAVTRVIMWLLCDHGVDASKEWVFVAHFIHLFNTTMPMPCTDVHSGAPMSHFLHRRVGMGCQALNFLSRGNYVFKSHACMLICKMYNHCTKHLTRQPFGKPPRSGSAVLLDKNDPVCFSISQK